MALSDFFTDTLTVQTKANTQAANAGAGRTDVVQDTSVPCRIQDVAGGQRYVAGSRGAINNHPIITEYGGIANGDTVVIDNGHGVTITCRVDSVNKRRAIGGIDDFYVLTVQEIEN